MKLIHVVVGSYLLFASFGLLAKEQVRDGNANISVRYSSSVAQSVSDFLGFPTMEFETGNFVSFPSGDWTFTAPVNGRYLLTCILSGTGTWSSGNSIGIKYGINAAYRPISFRRVDASYTGALCVSASKVIYLEAGDNLTILGYGDGTSVTLDQDSTANSITVTRLGD